MKVRGPMETSDISLPWLICLQSPKLQHNRVQICPLRPRNCEDSPGRSRVSVAGSPWDSLQQDMPTRLLFEMGISNSSCVICFSPGRTSQLAAFLKLLQSMSAEYSSPDMSAKASAGVFNGGGWVEGNPLSNREAQLGRENAAETY